MTGPPSAADASKGRRVERHQRGRCDPAGGSLPCPHQKQLHRLGAADKGEAEGPGAVDGEVRSGVHPQEYMMALDALCCTVPPEMVSMVAEHKTVKEAWDAMATIRVRDGRVKKNTAHQLRRDFELATCKEGESIEDYALRLKGMVATLATLGEVVEEPKASR
jgi:hypothetical protein